MENHDALRDERDRLLEENAKIRSGDPTGLAGPSSGNEKDADASLTRYLRSKVSFSC